MIALRKPCLRCLLSEMPEAAALAANIRELIALIPEEDRTPPSEVRTRLEACSACSHLNRGTCGLCGCYVEHRAEKRRAMGPDTPSRWPEGTNPSKSQPEEDDEKSLCTESEEATEP